MHTCMYMYMHVSVYISVVIVFGRNGDLKVHVLRMCFCCDDISKRINS